MLSRAASYNAGRLLSISSSPACPVFLIHIPANIFRKVTKDVSCIWASVCFMRDQDGILGSGYWPDADLICIYLRSEPMDGRSPSFN